ncbi:hypothetical protein, conserved in T. vivax [Trypanosoma vivax Y486]|uniref:Uncharacterized protein n=1 Tax=Trypanosoma vivax (strain Y486) TaxID=1055687 RepID=F9WPF1_TRYVY|nr:hypothetical protein, conserved in T. vivax [Trypanosoma vivax Y486]|eukprot:CCD19428.1 hypothetical protein, conserved in T. vivax [Trypanosoma vivax Y486]
MPVQCERSSVRKLLINDSGDTSVMPVQYIRFSVSNLLNFESGDTSVMPVQYIRFSVSNLLNFESGDTSVMPVQYLRFSVSNLLNFESGDTSVMPVQPVRSSVSSLINIESGDTSVMPVQYERFSVYKLLIFDSGDTSVMPVQYIRFSVSNLLNFESGDTSVMPVQYIRFSVSNLLNFESGDTSVMPVQPLRSNFSSRINIESGGTSVMPVQCERSSVRKLLINDSGDTSVMPVQCERSSVRKLLINDSGDTSVMPVQYIRFSVSNLLNFESGDTSVMPVQNERLRVCMIFKSDNGDISVMSAQPLRFSTSSPLNVESGDTLVIPVQCERSSVRRHFNTTISRSTASFIASLDRRSSRSIRKLHSESTPDATPVQPLRFSTSSPLSVESGDTSVMPVQCERSNVRRLLNLESGDTSVMPVQCERSSVRRLLNSESGDTSVMPVQCERSSVRRHLLTSRSRSVASFMASLDRRSSRSLFRAANTFISLSKFMQLLITNDSINWLFASGLRLVMFAQSWNSSSRICLFSEMLATQSSLMLELIKRKRLMHASVFNPLISFMFIQLLIVISSKQLMPLTLSVSSQFSRVGELPCGICVPRQMRPVHSSMLSALRLEHLCMRHRSLSVSSTLFKVSLLTPASTSSETTPRQGIKQSLPTVRDVWLSMGWQFSDSAPAMSCRPSRTAIACAPLCIHATSWFIPACISLICLLASSSSLCRLLLLNFKSRHSFLISLFSTFNLSSAFSFSSLSLRIHSTVAFSFSLKASSMLFIWLSTFGDTELPLTGRRARATAPTNFAVASSFACSPDTISGSFMYVSIGKMLPR